MTGGRRLHEHAMGILIGEIVAGRIAAGTSLPRETDLAEQFHVSRGVARECIRGLEERGLVAVKHGRGATVCDEDAWDMLSPDVLRAVFESDRGADVLGEYLECRRLLEISAAGLAAERASARDLGALSAAFERMRSSAELASVSVDAEDRFHAADIDFHHAVIRATGNRALGRMTEPIHRALGAARRPLARPAARRVRGLPEHQRILAAIAAGDAAAAREAMSEHLLTVEGYLREYAASLRDGEPQRSGRG